MKWTQNAENKSYEFMLKLWLNHDKYRFLSNNHYFKVIVFTLVTLFLWKLSRGANEPPGAVNEQNKVCERRKATQHIFKCTFAYDEKKGLIPTHN